MFKKMKELIEKIKAKIKTSVSFPLQRFVMRENPTEKYRYCNHHHEIGENHEVVEIGDCIFVANKAAIPLLRALNEVGLKTRTHHYDGGEYGFIGILLEDGVTTEIKTVQEKDAARTRYNGKKELLIEWNKDNA